LIRFFKMEPKRSKCKIHGSTIEDRAEKSVCVSLDNRRVVLAFAFSQRSNVRWSAGDMNLFTVQSRPCPCYFSAVL
jgi:hypothetical protein